MNKQAYVAQYQTTLVTKKSTPSEVKQAKKTASKLRDVMKQAALDYFKRTVGVDLVEEVKGSKYDGKISFKLDEKPTGNVTVEVTYRDKASRDIKAAQTYHIAKDRIFSM